MLPGFMRFPEFAKFTKFLLHLRKIPFLAFEWVRYPLDEWKSEDRLPTSTLPSTENVCQKCSNEIEN